MAKYVFPGADASPPLNWVIEQLERAGFEVQSSDTVGVHYSATIYRWYLNWMKNKDQVIKNYGVVWFRRWEVFIFYFIFYIMFFCRFSWLGLRLLLVKGLLLVIRL